MKKILNLSLLLLFWSSLFGQNDYWQQEVNYEIHVKLNDTAHSLSANIEIEYINNSPNTLDFLMFHLWPNAYRNESTALCEQMLDQGNTDLYFATDEEKGFIDSLEFTSQEKILRFELDKEHIDIAKVHLDTPLKPGEKIIISTPFYVKIPSSDFSRLGHHEQSYQITQWYPKPAVYDNQGWNAFPYLNTGEFYSEFGSFDVFITLPKNYIVGATGDLVDCKEEEEWLDSIAAATLRKSYYSSDLDFPDSDSLKKTIHYHQDKVHDFAWFADKRYHVLKGEAELKSGKKVTTWAMYTNQEHKLWTSAISYLNRSIKFYSKQVGEYPYNQVTAVQGALSAGAGMEYPNITIIGESYSAKSMENVIMHEVGHNWFYGILGFNERRYPWMDEGLNTYIETLYMQKYYPRSTLGSDILPSGVNLFGMQDYSAVYENYFSNLFQWRRNLNPSVSLPSEDYTMMNYGIAVYGKTALFMLYLQDYLGEKKMRLIMRDFYAKWAYKHPSPKDMENFWTEKTGEDLSWLFQKMIVENGDIDYKITGLGNKDSQDSLTVSVRNKGDVISPFNITAIDEDGDVLYKQWYKGFDGKEKLSFPKGNFHRLSIDGDKKMTDIYRENDQVYVDGMFKKRKRFRMKGLWSLPKDDYSTLYWYPAMGWNIYNKFMLGAVFYNSLVFEKKWQYQIMPLYSFKQNNLNGAFSVFRNLYPKGKTYRVSIGVTGRKYNYNYYDYESSFNEEFNLSYYKIAPQVLFDFRGKDGLSTDYRQLRFRVVVIGKENLSWKPEYTYSSTVYPVASAYETYEVYQIDFKQEDRRRINPYGFSFDFQANQDFVRLTADLRYRISYGKKKNSGFDMRVFAGVKTAATNGMSFSPKLRMAGYSGSNDYLYDGVFAGRSENTGMWSQQMIDIDGGFYVPTILGQSSNWLTSVNLRASLPKISFIKAYANIGWNEGYNNELETLWEAGFLISIIDRKFEVYFPALWSQNIQDVFDLNSQTNYGEKIRFTMRMELGDPFKIIKELHL